jgi:hypothetical protein
MLVFLFGKALVIVQGVSSVNVSAVSWWQVVTGVIAIPSALLGLYYLSLQIKKIRVESKDLQTQLSMREVDEEKLEQVNIGGTVSVASQAKIKNSCIGAIKGVQSRSAKPGNVEHQVIVFNKGEMENSVAGDIVGIEYQASSEEDKL